MNLEALINQNYVRFSESDRAVWSYLAEHRRECETVAIDEMARRCCVSRTAVMRFAQKLGLHGFAELKAYLRADNAKVPVSDQIECLCQTYQNVAASIRQKNCDALFAVLENADRILLYGEGMVQASIKKEFKRIFMSAGIMAYDTPSGEEMENLLPLLTERDLCVMISVSGENEKMVKMARLLRVQGSRLLSITKNRDNTLAHLCDFRLYVEASSLIETPIHWLYDPVTAYFMLIDILFLKYIDYRKRKEEDVCGSNS